MDQESFRQLLSTTGALSASASGSNTKSKAHAKSSRGSLFTTGKGGEGKDGKDGKKKKKKDGDGEGEGEGEQPAFRPRTLKKGAGGEAYRDRAAERRAGLKGDYAQVGIFSVGWVCGKGCGG